MLRNPDAIPFFAFLRARLAGRIRKGSHGLGFRRPLTGRRGGRRRSRLVAATPSPLSVVASA